jgi:hypothetical protein
MIRWHHKGNEDGYPGIGAPNENPVVDVNRSSLFCYCPHPIKN